VGIVTDTYIGEWWLRLVSGYSYWHVQLGVAVALIEWV